MNYHFLRELADSWVLLALFVFFLGTWVWAFRPGSREIHGDAANVPFRHEDRPLTEAGCGGSCGECDCGSKFNTDPEVRS
ncbi:MAG: cbb3-type cytochrome c oxidase subunit 3 [Marivivens sp.]|jgi:cytochrome c oxidase cbb3-type subunit 4|nr:cbb3-type cytochrome c oxidase subunit 3 [Marivivens sp.]